jgi:hypothetical protein
MANAADKLIPNGKRWFQKKRFWLIAAVVLLLGTGVLGFYYAWLNRTPEAGGSLTLREAGDTRFYVNDKLIGKGQVSFSLLQLFGDKNHQPLAIELTDEPSTGLVELVSGPGAQALHKVSIGGIGGAFVNISGDCILARRADASLDQVFAFIFDWSPPNEPAQRFLLPVRLRMGGMPSEILFSQAGQGITARRNPAYLRVLGRSAEENILTIDFTPASPPNELADEIKTKGLWEPEVK